MTIRMRYMELPGNQYVLVVDRVPIGEQDMFADAFGVFAEGLRERTGGRCASALVFHDSVDLPQVDPVPLELPGMEVAEMPICKPCRSAADGTDIRIAMCSECGKAPMAVYRDDVPEAHQKVYVHKNAATGARCEGSRLPPVFSTGHDDCDGCPCQHRQKGSWRGGD